jgi:hypothetical protein
MRRHVQSRDFAEMIVRGGIQYTTRQFKFAA